MNGNWVLTPGYNNKYTVKDGYDGNVIPHLINPKNIKIGRATKPILVKEIHGYMKYGFMLLKLSKPLADGSFECV